jgi:hypothetical protein
MTPKSSRRDPCGASGSYKDERFKFQVGSQTSDLSTGISHKCRNVRGHDICPVLLRNRKRNRNKLPRLNKHNKTYGVLVWNLGESLFFYMLLRLTSDRTLNASLYASNNALTLVRSATSASSSFNRSANSSGLYNDATSRFCTF